MSDDIFDLDAAAAEVMKEPFRFRYKGREWSLVHMSDIDIRVSVRAGTGDAAAVQEALRLGLGDQHDEFDKLPQPISVIGELFGRWRSHAGLAEGESTASPDSSESMAGPSKRPSQPTTPASASVTSSPAS